VEAKATAKYIRTAPRKARLVADEIRGKMVGDALSLLQFSINRSVAEDISKLIKSAVANIQSKNTDITVDADELRVANIYVNEGPVLKRYRARAQGRAGKIIKRMCHISVTVAN